MPVIYGAPTTGIQLSIGTTVNVGAYLSQVYSGYNFSSYYVYDLTVDNTGGNPPPSTSYGRWFNSAASDSAFFLNGTQVPTQQFSYLSSTDINNLTIRLGPDIGSYLYIYAYTTAADPFSVITSTQILVPILPAIYNDPTPNTISASDVVAAASTLLNAINGTLSPNGCHDIARTIAAMAGAPLPINSGSITPSGNLDGGYWTAIMRGASSNTQWLQALRPGDIVRADYVDPSRSQHTFTVLEVNGGMVRSIDNANSSGAILDHWRDYSTIMDPASVTIYRITESLNTIYGTADNDALIGSMRADSLRGGLGNDTLIGGDGNDDLIGGAGSDVLNGGNGWDTARYDSATSLIVAGLSGWTNYGDAAGDTFTSVEGLYATAYGDFLGGDGNANSFYGLGGDDSIWGYAGNDFLYGGDGNDILYGGAGGDYLEGGAGWDTIRYDDAAASVIVGLSGWTNYGDAAGDTFSGIESIFASNFTDFLGGDGNSNAIYGRGGDDSIWGYAGTDWLYGGDGNDILYGGAGGDYLEGGAGWDTARYDDASAGVVVGLSGWTNHGDAAGDNFNGVEAIFASNFTDYLGGDSASNALYGRAGNDGLWGYDGNDYLYGGQGNDSLYGGNGADLFQWNLGDGNDFIADFDVNSGDVIQLLGSGFTTFAQVQAAMSQTPGQNQTQIAMGSATLYIWGVLPGQFTANDFTFA